MKSTFLPKQADIQLCVGDFFDSTKNTETLRVLNEFLFENFKIQLFFNDLDFGIYMVPKIDGRAGWFIGSSKTDGSMIRGWMFDDLMYKLGAMIIGEEHLKIVTDDFKGLYVLLYHVDSKKFRTLGYFYNEDGHIREEKCRSCGVK